MKKNEIWAERNCHCHKMSASSIFFANITPPINLTMSGEKMGVIGSPEGYLFRGFPFFQKIVLPKVENFANTNCRVKYTHNTFTSLQVGI